MDIEVRLMAAKNLKGVHFGGKFSDPYCILKLVRTGEQRRSKICLNTINPLWYQSKKFFDVYPGDELQVRIFSTSITNDTQIGLARIALDSALLEDAARVASSAANPVEKPSVPCFRPAPPAQCVTASVYPQADQCPRPALYRQPAKSHPHPTVPPGSSAAPQHSSYYGYPPPTPTFQANASIQRSMTTEYTLSPQGSISMIIAPVSSVPDMSLSVPAKPFKQFHVLRDTEECVHTTWKVTMLDVDNFFDEIRQPWNREYEAARQIFQGPQSLIARPMLRMQHAFLYGGGAHIKLVQDARKQLQEVSGNLLDARDFLGLITHGIRRGKSRLFTYVLMPDALYIAETGARFFKDIMSKHAMHASGRTHVVYAGEFHIRPGNPKLSEPTHTLIIDNNSGTYAPDKGRLSSLEDVFQRNFPGLAVRAMDFNDVILKQYVQELKATEGTK